MFRSVSLYCNVIIANWYWITLIHLIAPRGPLTVIPVEKNARIFDRILKKHFEENLFFLRTTFLFLLLEEWCVIILQNLWHLPLVCTELSVVGIIPWSIITDLRIISFLQFRVPLLKIKFNVMRLIFLREKLIRGFCLFFLICFLGVIHESSRCKYW